MAKVAEFRLSTNFAKSQSNSFYTKVGRVIHFSCKARWSNQGSWSDNAVLHGLPFTSSSDNSTGLALGLVELIDFKGGQFISAQVAGSVTYITWREINDDGNPVGLAVDAFNNGGNDVIITGHYFV